MLNGESVNGGGAGWFGDMVEHSVFVVIMSITQCYIYNVSLTVLGMFDFTTTNK